MKFLVNFYSSYFERLSKKRFEIKVQEFKLHLNKTLTNDCCSVFVLQFEIEA